MDEITVANVNAKFYPSTCQMNSRSSHISVWIGHVWKAFIVGVQSWQHTHTHTHTHTHKKKAELNSV